MCIDIYDHSALCGCWFVVYIRWFIYTFLNVCPFDYMAVTGNGKVGPVNHTSWMTAVTPSDRPMSVRIRYVVELFGDVFVLLCCPFWQFCWYKGYCRTESDFFLYLFVQWRYADMLISCMQELYSFRLQCVTFLRKIAHSRAIVKYEGCP